MAMPGPIQAAPLYLQVKRALVAAIRRGAWTGGRLPPEDELAGLMRVSRATVREALAALARDGVVVKKQGLGNLILTSALTRYRGDLAVDFGDLLADAGHQVEVSQSPVTSVTSGGLTYTQVLRADGRAAVAQRYVVPGEAVRCRPAPSMAGRDLGAFLELATGRAANHAVVTLVPCLAGPELAGLFGIGEDEPLLAWSETYRGLRDEELCQASTYFNPELDLALLRQGPFTGLADCPVTEDRGLQVPVCPGGAAAQGGTVR